MVGRAGGVTASTGVSNASGVIVAWLGVLVDSGVMVGTTGTVVTGALVAWVFCSTSCMSLVI